MADCSDLISLQDQKDAKINADSINEFVNSDNPSIVTLEGKTKKTVQGIADDSAELLQEVGDLAEQQRTDINNTFQAQFAYKRIGNISDYVGDTLTDDDRLNAYQFPDDSGEWYGPIQSQTFPIVIPADPSNDAGWAIVSSVTGDWGGISQGTEVKHRRGANAEILAGTPAIGELWFNTTDNTIHMGDGVTVGGHKIRSSYTHLTGVDYTGATDSTQAVSDGILSAKVTGKKLWLGDSGTILCDLDITASNVIIEGGEGLILKGGATTAISLHGDNNVCRGFSVEDTNRNSDTLWLDGDNCLADTITAYNSVKSTSPTALFGDLIRVTGNNSGMRWCETYNGHNGLKLDNGDTPTERSKGQFMYQCKSHDNIRGGNIKAECSDFSVSQCHFIDNDVNNDQGSDGLLCERNVTGASIKGNYFHRNGEHGLYFQGDNSQVLGNFADDNHGSGLKFGGKKSDNFNDSDPLVSDAVFNAAYISESNNIGNNNCKRNGVAGSTNAGIYIQETHRGYKVHDNDCQFNQYGIRAVNEGLGGEIDNLELNNNTALNNLTTDMTLSVKSECEIINGVYGNIATFMTEGTFNDLSMKGVKVDILITAAVQRLKLRDVDVTQQFTASSAADISIKSGCVIHSAGDINMPNVREIVDSKIVFDTNGALSSTASSILEKIVNVEIEAYSNTSTPLNLGAFEPDNIVIDGLRVKSGATNVRAVVLTANGHTVSGVKSDNNSGFDIVQVNGDDCSVTQCTSTVSKSARVTLNGDNNIAVANQATVLDNGTSNIRNANRSEP